jgi:hypothetical protein
MFSNERSTYVLDRWLAEPLLDVSRLAHRKYHDRLGLLTLSQGNSCRENCDLAC